MSLLLYEVTYSQVPGIRAWASLGSTILSITCSEQDVGKKIQQSVTNLD